jgi:hypothetical protein
VIPFNKGLDRLWAKYKSKLESMAGNRAYCKELSANMTKWINALRAITWPSDVASDAKQLVRYEAAGLSHLTSCRRGKTWAEINKAWSRYESATSRAAEYANLVRLGIGLQPVAG